MATEAQIKAQRKYNKANTRQVHLKLNRRTDSDVLERLDNVPFPVYMSEFTAPTGCVEIASTERQASMAANGKTSRQTERLFVQERFAGEKGVRK